MAEGNVIEFPSRSKPAVEEHSEIKLASSNKEKEESMALDLGAQLVAHPLGIAGGFLDTSVDQTDGKLLGAIVEGGSYGLLKQTLPGMTLSDEDRDARLRKEHQYLQDAIGDRLRTGIQPFPPINPAHIDSTGSLNIGVILDMAQTLTEAKMKNRYIEVNAQRMSTGVLGLPEDQLSGNALYEERLAVDRNYLIDALRDREIIRKQNHPKPTLRIIK